MFWPFSITILILRFDYCMLWRSHKKCYCIIILIMSNKNYLFFLFFCVYWRRYLCSLGSLVSPRLRSLERLRVRNRRSMGGPRRSWVLGRVDLSGGGDSGLVLCCGGCASASVNIGCVCWTECPPVRCTCWVRVHIEAWALNWSIIGDSMWLS